MKNRPHHIILLAILLVVGGAIGWWAKGGIPPSPQSSLLDSVCIPMIIPSPLLDSLRQQIKKDRQT